MLMISKTLGLFECHVLGATGSPTTGRGLSVTEAVGDWCIQSGCQAIVCSPPDLLNKYRLNYEPMGERN